MIESQYRERITAIQDRIATAARRSGRTASDVSLVIVSKYLDLESTVPLIHAAGPGAIFGESRPQLLSQKAAYFAQQTATPQIAWHQIGPLQTNKIRLIAPWIARLHSGESVPQLTALHEELTRLHRVVPVLLEVNISGEPSKHGFEPEQVESVLETLAPLTALRIDGLMGMTSLNATEPMAHRQFASLRRLAERLRPQLPPEIQFTELSMGMTHDFEIAIEEGATFVRIGSAITA